MALKLPVSISNKILINTKANTKMKKMKIKNNEKEKKWWIETLSRGKLNNHH